MIKITLKVGTKPIDIGISLIVFILPAEFKHILVKVFHLMRK